MALTNVEDVLTSTASILGSRARRLSNGELRRTRGWITSHHRIFERHPSFEEFDYIETSDPRAPNLKRRRFRLRPGMQAPTPDSFGALGYAEDAAETYALLSQMKREGSVDASVRLLVALPAPYDILNFAVQKDDFRAVFPVYEQALIAEVGRIAAIVPAGELAIQWDAAHEFEYLATSSPMFNHMTREEMVAMLVRLGDAVPAGVELGYHCCYGNFNLKHFVEPTDMGDMVDVMNRVTAAIGRSIQFIHMPVPINRTDDAYFAPLRELKRDPRTEFYLGLAHDGDGVPGTVRRAEVAGKVISDFGISTECGLEMRTRENILQLLHIQADAAAQIDKMSAA
jgi:hypothetical protein